MRFGCCLNMVATKPGGIGIEHVKNLAAMGYDYVELPLAEIMSLSDEEIQHLMDTLEESGISCEVCNNFFPKNLRLTGSNVDIEAVLLYAEKALAMARRLGVKVVVFGSGPAKNVPDGFSLSAGYAQVVDLLQHLDPLALKNGITIVIEPLRKAECNLINTFKEGVDLAKDASKENIRVLVDFYHLSVEEEPAENLLQDGRKYLRHVHIANPEGRVYPKHTDDVSYESFIKTLKSLEYNGRVSCEAYSADFTKDAQESLAFLKSHIE